jgi:hypothetical protein
MRPLTLAALSLALVAMPLACEAGIGGRASPSMPRHRVQVIYDYNSGDPAFIGYFWVRPCAHHHHIYDRHGGPWPGDVSKGDVPPKGTPDSTPRCPVVKPQH